MPTPVCNHEVYPIERCGCAYHKVGNQVVLLRWCKSHPLDPGRQVSLLPCAKCNPDQYRVIMEFIENAKKTGLA